MPVCMTSFWSSFHSSKKHHIIRKYAAHKWEISAFPPAYLGPLSPAYFLKTHRIKFTALFRGNKIQQNSKTLQIT